VKQRIKRLLLPDRLVHARIMFGPFRGAIMIANGRNSMRKVLGLYEHELNRWLKTALPRVTRVLDVGANDGYFTFGCAAAFRRLGQVGEIIAFEPEQRHIDVLKAALKEQPQGGTGITLTQTLVGSEIHAGATTLDAVQWKTGHPGDRAHTLVKIDVEGAELGVLNGAGSWLRPSNLFLIEVHEREYLRRICELFSSRGLELERINQRSLPILGYEERRRENWWLVSNMSRLTVERHFNG
jgi:Methyltransferase FkbM domain